MEKSDSAGPLVADPTGMLLFARVVQHGSFTAAARRSGTPVSTVSRKVADLEKALGAQLLRRSTRSLALTEVGQVYFEHCQRALEALENANAAVGYYREQVAGTLRLTVPPSLSGPIFEPLIATFTQRYPLVKVQVFATERAVQLIDEGLDMAFRVGPLEDSSLVARRVCSYRHRLVAAPSYLAEHGSPQHPGDLKAHRTLAFLHWQRPTKWALEPVSQVGESCTVQVEPSLSLNDYAALSQAALAGRGIAELPELLLGEAMARGALVPVLLPWQFPVVDLAAVYPSQRFMRRAARLLLDLSVEMIQQQAVASV